MGVAAETMGPLGRICEAVWVASEAEGWAKERTEAVSVAWEAGAAVSAAAEPLVAAARLLSHSTRRRRTLSSFSLLRCFIL